MSTLLLINPSTAAYFGWCTQYCVTTVRICHTGMTSTSTCRCHISILALLTLQMKHICYVCTFQSRSMNWRVDTCAFIQRVTPCPCHTHCLATSAVLLQYCFCTFSWRSLTIAMCVGRGSMGARSLGVQLQAWMRMCFSHHRRLIDKRLSELTSDSRSFWM